MTRLPKFSILNSQFLILLSLYTLLSSNANAQIKVENITIARDSFGVPHIFSKTDAEAAFGLAFVSCEDNFKDIQELLILTRGRLGEVKGKEGAAADYFARLIRAKEITDEKYLSDLSESFRKITEAYADGINKYAQTHTNEITLKNVFPINGKDIIRGYYIILTSMVGTPKALQYIIKGKPDEYIFGATMGSNAFAANKNKTEDGSTYLAINPHIPLDGVMTWSEAHIQSEEGWNFYGSFFPCMVAPAMGSSTSFGWGVTFNWPDYIDIYVLELNPDNKNQYKVDGKFLDFERQKTTLKVKTKVGIIKVRRELLWTIYGPAYRTKKGVYALRHNNIGNIKAAEQWYLMSKATNFEQFKKAMRMHNLPLFNIMYADNKNNIAHFFNGILPERCEGYDWQKTLPGNTTKTLWNTCIPFGKMPYQENPNCGYLYNTNNTPFRDTETSENLKASDFDSLSGWNWNRINNRDLRIYELLNEKNKLSFTDFKKIKYDVSYPTKGGGINKTLEPLLKLNAAKYPEITDAVRIMQRWDKSCTKENKQAALFLFTFNKLFAMKKAGYRQMESGLTYSEEELVTCIKYAQKEMLKRYGQLEIPLGAVQKIMRGGIEKSAAGGPETLNAAYSDYKTKGNIRVINGDTFIMFAKYNEQGYELECVVPYGVCKNAKGKFAKHYTDQMDLYSNQKTKKITLDKSIILKNAEIIYHPY